MKKSISYKILKFKIKEYHFQGYKNLVLTLVSLNSAGIAGSLAFLANLCSNNTSCTDSRLISMKLILEFSLNSFTIGLILILFEIFLEYVSYFSYKCSIDHNKYDEYQTRKKRFSCIQLVLLILSGLSILFGLIHLIYLNFDLLICQHN